MFTTSFRTIRHYNGGAALANDDDPNTTAPLDDRILSVPSGFPNTGATLGISGFGGTSATVKAWVFNPAHSKWLCVNTAVSTVTANFGTVLSYGSSEKKVFVQIVANTGLTELYYGIL